MALASKFNVMCEKQRLVVELENVAGSLALWAQEKFREDQWSIADVKMALRNAARVCDGRQAKFTVLLMNGAALSYMFDIDNAFRTYSLILIGE